MTPQDDMNFGPRAGTEQTILGAFCNTASEEAEGREGSESPAKGQQQEDKERMKVEANSALAFKFSPTESQPVARFSELYDAVEGQRVTVVGRVHSAKVQTASLAILVLRDEIHTIPAIVTDEAAKSYSGQMMGWCRRINIESLVQATGLLKWPKMPKMPIRSTSIPNFELHVETIHTILEAAEALPVQVVDCIQPPRIGSGTRQGEVGSPSPPDVSLDVRLNNRVLEVRDTANQAIFKLKGGITNLFTEYMNKHGFQWIHTPKLVHSSTEGDVGFFEVKYFDRQAYLAQSPQFFKQMAIAMDMKRVFEIGPLFRAEYSDTNRHMTEFTGLDFEMVIKQDYREVLSFAESLIIFIVRSLQERGEYKRLIRVVEQAYPSAGNFKLPAGDRAVRITFAEGVRLLNEAGVETSESDNLSSDQEKALGHIILSKYSADFFSIEKYPRAVRPFYSHPDPSDPLLCNSYDLFMRGQEVMSGSQRIHTYPELCESMCRNDPPLDPNGEALRHYADAFRYGCAPHGGGGFGLNRILQFFLGLPDIRLATLFPRDPSRLAP
ncbi:MAG: hypothetical protein M1839_002878 [Geoglossum umbratile]|nr:MAG: hypothetical protein M1839_002878 [Geoglossum umbratile]